MASDPTTLAERYVLESPIARGGMGTVWRARDEVLARPIAVKILNENLSDDAEFIARFRREALSAAALSHPHIVAIYDTGVEKDERGNDQHFIVMEHCGGGTLTDLINAEAPLDADRAISIGIDVCSALGHAHRNELVHRDVKPANILFTPDGTLKVGDFGIAKAAFGANDITTTGTILGTVLYISPEQANGLEPDARSDLYAVGVLLYELVTGRPPFNEDTQIATAMKHVRDEPPPPRSIRAGVPRALEAVILKALEKDPDDRFHSADEMADALRAARRGGGETAIIHQPLTPDRPRARKPKRRDTPRRRRSDETRWIVPVILVILLAIAAVLVIPPLLDRDDDTPSNGNGGGGGASGNSGPVTVDSVSDLDPYGDGSEHPETAADAADGDPSSAWSTEDYRSSIALTKGDDEAGVGLVFDLGEAMEIAELRIQGRLGEIQIFGSEDSPADERAMDLVTDASNVTGNTTVTLDEPATYRYWLVWIRDLPPPGTGVGEIAEVEFLAP